MTDLVRVGELNPTQDLNRSGGSALELPHASGHRDSSTEGVLATGKDQVAANENAVDEPYTINMDGVVFVGFTSDFLQPRVFYAHLGDQVTTWNLPRE